MSAACDNCGAGHGLPECDSCDDAARWLAFAAYETDLTPGATHPSLARYPAAMVRACDAHLLPFLDGDAMSPGSTNGWYVRRIEGT